MVIYKSEIRRLFSECDYKFMEGGVKDTYMGIYTVICSETRRLRNADDFCRATQRKAARILYGR